MDVHFIMGIKVFTMENLQCIRNQCLALDRSSLDLLLMGHIMANSCDFNDCFSFPQTTVKQKASTKFYHHGIRVSTNQ